MAENVKILVEVDAQGTPRIEALQRGFRALRREINGIQATTQRGALFQIEQATTQTRNAVFTRLREFETQVGRFNRNLLNTGTRIGRTFAFSVAGGVAIASAAFAGLVKEFTSVNEQFKGLEITLRSTFRSLSIARDLRDEIAQITAFSPLPLQDISQAIRAFSVIPFTRNQIAQQGLGAGFGTGQGFSRNLIRVVEQLVTLRPDKQAADAVFAIRELLTGEFRSLIRRFDVPVSLLTAASGRSVLELKDDPQLALDALQKGFGEIITPQAVQQLARQPKILFENILEQIFQRPALAVGEAQGERGLGAFDTIIDSVFSSFLRMNQFIERDLKPIADDIADSVVSLFFNVRAAAEESLERLLSFAGFGSGQLPGVDVVNRVFLAVQGGFELMEERLPGIIRSLSDFAAAVGRAFQNLNNLIFRPILNLASEFGSFFVDSPITASAVLFFSTRLPELARAAFGAVSEVLANTLTTISANRGLSGTRILSENIVTGLTEANRREAIRNSVRLGRDGSASILPSAPGSVFNQFGAQRLPGGINTPITGAAAISQVRFLASRVTERDLARGLRAAPGGDFTFRETGDQALDRRLRRIFNLGSGTRTGAPIGREIGQTLVRELSPLLAPFVDRNAAGRFTLAANTPPELANLFGRGKKGGAPIRRDLAESILAGAAPPTLDVEERRRGNIFRGQQRTTGGAFLGGLLGSLEGGALSGGAAGIAGSLGSVILSFGASILLFVGAVAAFEGIVSLWNERQERIVNEQVKASQPFLSGLGRQSESIETLVARLRDDTAQFPPTVDRNNVISAVGIGVDTRQTGRSSLLANEFRGESSANPLEEVVSGVSLQDVRGTIREFEEKVIQFARDRTNLIDFLDGTISSVQLESTGEFLEQTDRTAAIDTELQNRVVQLGISIGNFDNAIREQVERRSQRLVGDELRRFNDLTVNAERLLDVGSSLDQVTAFQPVSRILAAFQEVGNLPAIDELNAFVADYSQKIEPLQAVSRNSQAIVDSLRSNFQGRIDIENQFDTILTALNTTGSEQGEEIRTALNEYTGNLASIATELDAFGKESSDLFLNQSITIAGEERTIKGAIDELRSLATRSPDDTTASGVAERLISRIRQAIDFRTTVNAGGFIEKAGESILQGLSQGFDLLDGAANRVDFNRALGQIQEAVGPTLRLFDDEIGQLESQLGRFRFTDATTERAAGVDKISELSQRVDLLRSTQENIREAANRGIGGITADVQASLDSAAEEITPLLNSIQRELDIRRTALSESDVQSRLDTIPSLFRDIRSNIEEVGTEGFREIVDRTTTTFRALEPEIANQFEAAIQRALSENGTAGSASVAILQALNQFARETDTASDLNTRIAALNQNDPLQAAEYINVLSEFLNNFSVVQTTVGKVIANLRELAQGDNNFTTSQLTRFLDIQPSSSTATAAVFDSLSGLADSFENPLLFRRQIGQFDELATVLKSQGFVSDSGQFDQAVASLRNLADLGVEEQLESGALSAASTIRGILEALDPNQFGDFFDVLKVGIEDIVDSLSGFSDSFRNSASNLEGLVSSSSNRFGSRRQVRELNDTAAFLGVDRDFSSFLDADSTGNRLAEQVRKAEEIKKSIERELLPAISEQLKTSTAEQASQLVDLRRQIEDVADSQQDLIDSVRGQGGIGGSFLDGFRTVNQEFRAFTDNFTELGEGLAVSLSDNLGSAFGDLLLGISSLEEAWRSFTNSFVQEVVRMVANKAVQSLLGGLFGGLGGGISPGASGAPGAAIPQSDFNFSLASRARGGIIDSSPTSGPNALIMGGEYAFSAEDVRHYGSRFFEDLNAKRIDRRRFTLPKFNSGGVFSGEGPVRGGSGVRDDIFAKLQPNQFVLRKEAVDFYGDDVLRQIQSRSLPKFQTGGLVGSGTVLPQREGSTTVNRIEPVNQTSNIEVSVPITINGSDGVGDSRDAGASQQEFAREMGRVVQASVKQEVINFMRSRGMHSQLRK